MTVWDHLTTVFKKANALLKVGLVLLIAVLSTTVFLNTTTRAASGVNQILSFQGRLLNANGSIVADGYYNMQFKIYQDGSGTAAGNPDGTLKWTETYTNNGSNQGVEIRNGYFSIDLGSKTAFGNNVDWNQSVLWLSMNVAGSANLCSTFGDASCPADGEMLPMRRINAVPMALNSNMLGGKTANQFVQIGQGLQVDAGSASSIFINKTGTGNLVQLQNAGQDIFSITNSGSILFGGSSNKSISADVAPAGTAGAKITIAAGSGGTGTGSNGGDLELVAGNAGGTDGNGGNITIDSGSGTGTGTGGTIAIGTTNSSQITIGNSSSQIALGGPTTIKADSPTALTITDSSNNKVMVVDTVSGHVGIGPGTTTPSYSLDVTGDTNVSGQYRIDGVVALTQTSINFSGNTSSLVAAATSQSLLLTSDNNVDIKSGADVAASFSGAHVQIGTGTGSSGNVTLLTLDRSSTAPTGTAQDLLGSMYYDTTLGKIQCYEASGWGNCTSAPDSFVSITPSYTGAVINGLGTGNMSTDFCSDSLDINDGSSSQPSICGTNETYNYYRWTTAEITPQTRSIYVNYQLPANFKEFVPGLTSLLGKTDDIDSIITYQIYRNNSTFGLTPCGTQITVSTGVQTNWTKAAATDTNDPANCNFAAGDGLVVKINMTANNGHNAYISNLGFTYSNN